MQSQFILDDIMYIHRTIESFIQQVNKQFPVLLLTGPRQVGKTTLIHAILKGKNYIFLNADDPSVKKLLTNPNTE